MSLFSSLTNGSQQPSSDQIMAVLQQEILESGEMFIILDALDECTDRFELLETIEEIYQWNLGNLHFLVTSRREKDIGETLGPIAGNDKLISIQSALVNDDIRSYIQQRLRTDRPLKRWQSRLDVQSEIENALMGKAAGM